MPSKELKEMQQEELDAEPSLDRMFDLKNPEVLKGLGRIAARALAEEKERLSKAEQEPVISDERLR
jgi:hypothetical protein